MDDKEGIMAKASVMAKEYLLRVVYEESEEMCNGNRRY